MVVRTENWPPSFWMSSAARSITSNDGFRWAVGLCKLWMSAGPSHDRPILPTFLASHRRRVPEVQPFVAM